MRNPRTAVVLCDIMITIKTVSMWDISAMNHLTVRLNAAIAHMLLTNRMCASQQF